jgi:hypothetical protein
MRLDYLKVDRFKNLNGFLVDLDETSREPVTVILGRNGAGKSNFFEALVIIFRDLIQARPTTAFGYDLRYTLRGGKTVVQISNPRPRGDASTTPFTTKNGESIEAFACLVTEDGATRRIGRKEARAFLPKYVVTYLLRCQQQNGASFLSATAGFP